MTEIDIITTDEIEEVIVTGAIADLIAKIAISEAIMRISIVPEIWIGTDGEMEAREIGMSLKAVGGLTNHYVSLVPLLQAIHHSMAKDSTRQDQSHLLEAYLKGQKGFLDLMRLFLLRQLKPVHFHMQGFEQVHLLLCQRLELW